MERLDRNLRFSFPSLAECADPMLSWFEVVHLHRRGHPRSPRYRYSATKHKYSQSGYPAASSTFSFPVHRTYTVGSACIPSHVRRCIIFPRHAVASAHAKPVTLVTYTSAPVCPVARATACISQKSWHGTTTATTLSRPVSFLS